LFAALVDWVEAAVQHGRIPVGGGSHNQNLAIILLAPAFSFNGMLDAAWSCWLDFNPISFPIHFRPGSISFVVSFNR